MIMLVRWAGFSWHDLPKLTWTRLTVCRRYGHHYRLDEDYCFNCGAPWLPYRKND
jgi:ribosomal protein L37E